MFLKLQAWYTESMRRIGPRAEEPQVAFLAVFCILMFLLVGTFALAGGLPPVDFVIRAGAISSGFAGWVGAATAIRRRAPWLSWGKAFGLPVQCLVVSLIVYAAFTVGLRDGISWRETGWAILILGWAFLAIASVWGLLKNRWWGYFGEAIVICSAFAVYVYVAPAFVGRHDPGIVGRFLMIPYLLGFYRHVFDLIKTGFQRWRERRLVETISDQPVLSTVRVAQSTETAGFESNRSTTC